MGVFLNIYVQRIHEGVEDNLKGFEV